MVKVLFVVDVHVDVCLFMCLAIYMFMFVLMCMFVGLLAVCHCDMCL